MPDWIASVQRMARQRVTLLRDIEIDVGASWAGLYEMSPDKHAILGPPRAATTCT